MTLRCVQNVNCFGYHNGCSWRTRFGELYYLGLKLKFGKITVSFSHRLSKSWWRPQMETFPRYCPSVRGIHRSLVDSPHNVKWRGDLMFCLIWTNGWANAGDVRRHRGHYDDTVMVDLRVSPLIAGPPFSGEPPCGSPASLRSAVAPWTMLSPTL